ncbi:hypothetical protein BYT27DRAFT_7209778 [Phlegmacium glaucopus]|nr:hypothetical protein BYT27DRAFT_7209778 [Phlegmacium glaucopus]
MTEGTRWSSTAGGCNVEGDAHNPVAQQSIDPLPLFIGNKSFGGALMIPMGVGFATEIAPESGVLGLGQKGLGIRGAVLVVEVTTRRSSTSTPTMRTVPSTHRIIEAPRSHGSGRDGGWVS